MSFFIYLKREITPPANRSLDKIISVKCAKKKKITMILRMLISFSGIWCLRIVRFAQKWPSSAR